MKKDEIRKNFAKNLNGLIERNEVQQKEVAIAAGVTQATFSSYVKGDAFPRPDKLQKIAEFFGITVNELITEKTKWTKIPVFGSVPAGTPIEAVQIIIDYEEIPSSWTKDGEYFGLRISGDSMSPRLCEGDVVIVRKQNDADNGDAVICFVNDDYEATCKIIKKNDEGITLIGRNPAFLPMFFTWRQVAELPVRILGKVVEGRIKKI